VDLGVGIFNVTPTDPLEIKEIHDFLAEADTFFLVPMCWLPGPIFWVKE
jgi:hypothetical protein